MKDNHDLFENHYTNYNSISAERSLHLPSKEESPATIETKTQRIKHSFYWFSLIASLNHALNYVVNAYSSTLLPDHLAGVTLGLNWCLNSVSGLTVATPAVTALGFRNAMIVSFWGYAFQIGTLYLCVVQPDIRWPVGLAGAVVAGFTSAIWWTAQGVCFELTCNKINEQSESNLDSINGSMNDIRSNLSATWTIIYQSADIFVFLTLSLIPLLGKVSITSVLLALFFLGVVTALLGFSMNDLGDKGHGSDRGSLFASIVAVPSQFIHDCRATLLAPFVFGFGITTAMFSYYLNDEAISESNNLGPLTLGLLEAFSYFIATISAYPYAYVSKKYSGGQHWVIQFGSLNFMLSGALVFALTNAEIGTWQNILIIKGIYGLGRGVFEGSCRAVYAELFIGKDLSTAFSAQTLLAGFSGGICYFIYGQLSRKAIAMITVVNGIVAIVFYALLLTMDYHQPQSWHALGVRLVEISQGKFYSDHSKSNIATGIDSDASGEDVASSLRSRLLDSPTLSLTSRKGTINASNP
jgi:hypothetical protein